MNAHGGNRGEPPDLSNQSSDFFFLRRKDPARAVDTIVELVAEGLDNKEIAARLYLSEGTVRNHISAILQKLDLKNRTQLVVRYYRDR